ncbi:MAG: putative rane protein [Candidatus Saccharibacteria bacterium]|nr:putative rane protein [Candidatus Saccharibacteria bacterium]
MNGISRFALRWFVSSLGLWIAAGLLGNTITYQSQVRVIVIAGFILALINVFIRPLVVILSLPAILLSLGLFMVIVNGFMVFLVSKFYPSLEITNFGAAILAGMIIGLVNYLVSAILEGKEEKS